jgi:hypothetical protein|tara:strand:+ start:2566 stop:3060 length:495 start_codon:yes stop_codon:yes gene_type:complete
MNITNIKRDNELNERIKERNMVYVKTNINLGIRPESTKYGYKPIMDRPVSNTVPIQKTDLFHVNTHYLPGNRQGPWDGFASRIHDESQLRNMFFANTKAQQGVYIPSSNSDLYQPTTVKGREHEKQTFPYLFNDSLLTSTTSNVYKENKLFNNDSRQMRLNEHK